MEVLIIGAGIGGLTLGLMLHRAGITCRIFEAAPDPKRFYAIPGADHNDTYLVGGEPYWQVWREFLGLAPEHS